MKPFWKFNRFPLPKAFITAIVISLTSHVIVLSMPIIGDKIASRPRETGLLTVHLAEFVPAPKEKDTIKEPAPVKEKAAPTPETTTETAVREDTVNMGSQDSRYRSYLLKIKKRIEDKWQYPEAALRKKEKGATTIKFSINNDGALYAQEILSSSGSQILDDYTLTVIRAGSPYDRLPIEMGLSRLHIVAVFHYRLTE